MQRRRFGRTGLEISEFTLGGGIVGGILIHPPDEVRLEALRRAVAAGCDWIDTAADYGKGESEKALGRLLPELSPRPRLSTKVRVDPAGLDDLAGQIRRSLEASFDRLRTDRVELFQLHNAIGLETGGRFLAVHEILRPGGVADVFDRLRADGLFRWHGITALGETRSILQVLDSGRFDTAQVYCNMLNPSAGRAMPAGWTGQDFAGVLEACRRHDMGVMNIRVLAGGALATDAPHGREVAVTSDADLAREHARAQKVFGRLGAAYGTRAQTAIRHSLANRDLSTIVVGVATLDQLDEALAAFAMGPLPEQAMAALETCYSRGL